MSETETNTKASSTLGVALKQAQTIVTFVYLSMVGIGMLYYHQKYSEFDINIFQYANIFYFLVAPFEDPFILLLCGVITVVIPGGYLLDSFVEKKAPRLHTIMNFGFNKVSWSKKMQSVSWPIAFVFLLVFYSQVYGERSKKTVLESEPITITFSDSQKMTGQMIGKTDSTLFLLNGAVVKAIPLGAEVKEIVITSSFNPDPEAELKLDAE